MPETPFQPINVRITATRLEPPENGRITRSAQNINDPSRASIQSVVVRACLFCLVHEGASFGSFHKSARYCSRQQGKVLGMEFNQSRGFVEPRGVIRPDDCGHSFY